MARCGCSGGALCSCVVTAGTNVTVTGNGNTGTPYVINAALAPITVSTTPTVQLILSGTTLSANVKLDTASGNLLVANANGLRLDCAALTSCLVSAGVTTVADTATIDASISGAGTSGSPYVISGVVKLDPAGILTTSGSGVLLTAATVQNSITVSGSTWPYACAETSAQPIYKNATTGALHGDAPYPASAGTNTGSTSPGTTAVPVSNTTIDTPTTGTITNPSTCRSAVVMVTFTAAVQYTIGTAGNGLVIAMNGTDLWNDVIVRTNALASVTYSTTTTLAAGASTTVNAPLQVRQFGAAGATYAATSWRANYIIVST